MSQIIKAMPTPTPLDLLASKTITPSELRTKEWDRVDAWTRERAFFMASVTSAEHLQAFRNGIAEVLQGAKSDVSARDGLRAYLEKSGYSAPEGLKGSIKDLSTTKRMKVAIETNVAMARGWADHQRLIGNPDFPAQRLYRAARAKGQPRDWVGRVYDFRGMPGVHLTGDPDEPMVALTNSPVWVAISRFGNPYPPFDFGSHMRVEPVDWDEAESLGLVRSDDEEGEDLNAMSSMNESVEMTPAVTDRSLRSALSEQLEGLAEWQGDKLVMTDPNGSRQYDWRGVGEIISAKNKAGIPQYQAKAFRDWVTDSSRFGPRSPGKGVEKEPEYVPLDEKEDMIRLIDRIKPISSEAPDGGQVSRVLSQNNIQDLDNLMASIIGDGFYGARKGYIAESWANNIKDYMNDYNIVLRCSDYQNRKRIDGIYSYITLNNKDTNIEGESLFPASSKFKVIGKPRKIETKNGVTYEINLKEI